MTTKKKTTKARASAKKKPVLVCTKHRGVFYGWVPSNQNMLVEHVTVSDVCMAIYWGTSRGVQELTATGPTSKTKLSLSSPSAGLRDVTAIFDVTAEAQGAFSRALQR